MTEPALTPQSDPSTNGDDTGSRDQKVLAERITRAVWSACVADARLLGAFGKPAIRPVDATVKREHYQASAKVAAPTLAAPHRSVGERIYNAVEATHGAVGMDTNLGILLLAAPMVHAVLNPVPGTTLRERVTRVLAGLDRRDADLAWQAVCIADPEGAAEHPLALTCHAAQLSLRQVMEAQSAGDRIAYQYAHDYTDIFAFTLPRLRQASAQWQRSEWPLNMVFLGLMARFPDSHVVRSHGLDAAELLRERAAQVHETLWRSATPAAHRPLMDAFFRELAQAGVHPRTSADLAVATLLAARLQAWTGSNVKRRNDDEPNSMPSPLTPRG